MSLIAYIGSYKGGPANGDGGIDVVEVSRDGRTLRATSRIGEPELAGYLVYAPGTHTLYAVNEQKNDGRGPVAPPAAVHAYTVDPDDGSLTPTGSVRAPGPRPTFLTLDERRGVLVSANHGDFDHVERVVQSADGTWTSEYVYDDGTVILYRLGEDGALQGIQDLVVFEGHGTDPNSSLQAGGHGQASAHPHCAVIDPSGRWVVVCDKGTDSTTVFALGDTLERATVLQSDPETGPRHIVFDASGTRAYMTEEFASRVASLSFDPETGTLTVLDQQSSVAADHSGPNEPADVRLHPNGRFVYVNNRGEDSVAWFTADPDGSLHRGGHVSLATSIHPGLAARSIAIDPTGTFLLVTDRPANTVRSYAIDPSDGSLEQIAEIAVPDPAFVTIVEVGR